MLEILRIQNIILIETAQVHFGAGFHVISGETGAGKSALLQALALVTGCKAELSFLRQGAKQGMVEAVFAPRCDEAWKQLLHEAELPWYENEPIVLRRELSTLGKTRSFYNDQLITQTLLKQMGALCLEIVGQQASYNVRFCSTQREFIDIYGGNLPLLTAFQRAFQHEKDLEKQLQQLTQHEHERVRQRQTLEQERAELTAANLQHDEEALLLQEHDGLQNAKVLLEGLETLSQRLGGRPDSLLYLAQREKQALERLSALEPSLSEAIESMQRVQMEVQDVYSRVGSTIAKLDFHPERCEEIEQRLNLLHQLKKRYGASTTAILSYAQEIDKRLQELDRLDMRQMELESLITAAQKETEGAAQKLTKARMAHLEGFAKQLQAHLEPLNMPKVQVTVKAAPKARCHYGDEEIEIFFLPNVGEKELSIADSSGGELSRIHLAIHMALCGKSHTQSIFFDEIDANIGGVAAGVVGDMLAGLSRQAQVICITHFPQVARHATHHLQIAKVEEEGRTLTKVTALSQEAREHELARMMGVVKGDVSLSTQ